MNIKHAPLYIAVAAAVASLNVTPLVLAQEPDLEEVLVTGSRAPGRSAEDLPVPVDVLSAQQLADTGQTEVGRMLQSIAPSFNFSSSSISDGTDALRPATLRGLGPDQTLVLVNGKRRHQASLIHINTSVGRGTAGVDMNAIPAAALKRIEVLRDGAAAQYGSDAIAGVINLVLRDADEGGRAYVTYGEYDEGDGATTNIDLNGGFSLGGNGFVNATLNYRDRESTNRAGLTGSCVYGGCMDTDGNGIAEIADPRELTFDRGVFRIGDAESEHVAAVLNAGYNIGGGELYSFITYSERKNESGAFYRNPSSGSSSALDDGDNVIPDGFLPLINSQIDDYSVNIGFQKDFDGGLGMDISYTRGENSIEYETSNTINYSYVNFLNFGMGLSDADIRSSIPRSAAAYDLELGLQTLNVDFNMPLGDFSLAFGGEYRIDDYKINSGDEYAYRDFDTMNGVSLYDQDAGGGTQGFPGIAPVSEVDEDRDIFSLYVDGEYEIGDNLILSAALRYDDYDDFGDSTNFKVAANWAVSDMVRLRGAVSSGFRAPSMQQQYFNNVSTQFRPDPDDPNGSQIPFQVGTFRNDSELAAAIGIPQLKEEESMSYSAGVILTPTDQLSITLDYYMIEIEDRIVFSNQLTGADDPSGNLEAALQEVGAGAGQFFLNGADTDTEGLDLVVTYSGIEMGSGNLDLTLAANHTETDVVDVFTSGGLASVDPAVVFSSQDISIIEEWQPEDRVNISGNYTCNNLAVNLSVNRFGEYTVEEGPDSRQDFDAVYVTDLKISYTLDSGVGFTVGGNNIFDELPDKDKITSSRGGTLEVSPGGEILVDSRSVFNYSRRSAPFGFNGAFWYAGISYDF